MAHFSNNLKFLRKKSGKTQDALSSELSIGRTTIANYEAGISEPNLETLLTFANYFGVTLDDLLTANISKGDKSEFILKMASHTYTGTEECKLYLSEIAAGIGDPISNSTI